MTDRIPVTTEFDYTSYDSEVADQLRDAADRIRARGRDQISAIIEIGKALADVKANVGHGNWGAWLASEFSMSVSTADRYMRGAKFVAKNFAANKFVTETNLTANVLFLISAKSTPPLLAQEVVDRIMANRPAFEKEVRRRLHDLKKQKGMTGKALAASNINRKSDRVATQQESSEGHDEAAAPARDLLEQIKRLVVKAADPVDIIKALILDLDDTAIQRLNTFLARIEPRNAASTRVDESLTRSPSHRWTGRADQPDIALVVAGNHASNSPLVPNGGPEVGVCGEGGLAALAPNITPSGPDSNGRVADLCSGDISGAIESPADNRTADVDPGFGTTDRAHTADGGSAAPVRASVGVSSPGINTSEHAVHEGTGLDPTVLAVDPTDPAGSSGATPLAKDGGFGHAAVAGDGANPIATALRDKTDADPESPLAPGSPLTPAEKELRTFYSDMSSEEQERDRYLIACHCLQKSLPKNLSPHVQRYLKATLTDQSSHRRWYLAMLPDAKKRATKPLAEIQQPAEPSATETAATEPPVAHAAIGIQPTSTVNSTLTR